jgi:hypothetical protein
MDVVKKAYRRSAKGYEWGHGQGGYEGTLVLGETKEW